MGTRHAPRSWWPRSPCQWVCRINTKSDRHAARADVFRPWGRVVLQRVEGGKWLTIVPALRPDSRQWLLWSTISTFAFSHMATNSLPLHQLSPVELYVVCLAMFSSGEAIFTRGFPRAFSTLVFVRIPGPRIGRGT